jgi:GNAT superfamily N-acetyltransferase
MTAFESHYEFVVRPGQASDLKAVRALIVELAEYEKAPDEVTLTLDQLERDLAAGCFQVTVAEATDGKVVGMALHHARYSTWKGKTWYLEDLVVTASWRGRGVGKAMFSEVVSVANAREAARLEWQVLDWNDQAIGFYQSMNASLDGAWLNGRLTREQLNAWLSRR